MLEFIAHCEKNGVCALPAKPETVAEFLMRTVPQGIKSSTIRRKLSSISAIHRLSSLDDPTKHSEVKITQRKKSTDYWEPVLIRPTLSPKRYPPSCLQFAVMTYTDFAIALCFW